MIERFQTSLYQLIGGMGSSSLGMVITSEASDPTWVFIGRIALIIGLIASIVALLNGLKVLCDNLSKTFETMKSRSIIKQLRHACSEVAARAKAESPKFFATTGRFFVIVALASIAAITADKFVGLYISELFRSILSYVFTGALVGAVVCKLTVKNTEQLYEELNKKIGNV